MQDINQITLTGNLTRDPELRTTPSGFNICGLRLAYNGRRKNQSGEWVDEPGYIDVVVFGKQGENVARFLSRGSGVAVQGRLKWREWEDKNTGQKRQAYEVAADNVRFMSQGGGNGAGGGGGGDSYGGGQQSMDTASGSGGYGNLGGDVPSDTSDFKPAAQPQGAGTDADDDIPFRSVAPSWDAVKTTPYSRFT